MSRLRCHAHYRSAYEGERVEDTTGRGSIALSLPNVTLCAADCVHPQLAAQALTISQSRATFGDVILFSNQPANGPFRSILIPALRSRHDYSHFILKDLANRIGTPYVLIIQWDGYVVNAPVWRPDFLDYDYLGAVWPWRPESTSVGNGGFSLRSRRLLELTAEDRFACDGSYNEDEWICLAYRQELENRSGIRFAPSALATRFSYERSSPDNPTFGFHGLFNMWRYVDDWTMTNMVHSLKPRAVATREFVELLLQYHHLRKFELVATLFKTLATCTGGSSLLDIIEKSVAQRHLAEELINQWQTWASVL